MRLGIIGSGRVGSALGKALATKGFPVLFYDVAESQLDPLKQGGYEVTTDPSAVEKASDILFTAVPTEALPNGDCDLSILRRVAKLFRTFDGVFVQVSTCPPLTARSIAPSIRRAEYVVHPSFYSVSRMEFDALHPINVLLGSKTGRPVEALTDIFRRFDGPINWGRWEEAELTKYADNCLSATLISYWNQIYLAASKLGLDPEKITRIVDRDPQYRSIFRFAGKAYGGACLVKDTQAFRNFLRKQGIPDTMVAATHEMNLAMKAKHGENDRHLVYRP